MSVTLPLISFDAAFNSPPEKLMQHILFADPKVQVDDQPKSFSEPGTSAEWIAKQQKYQALLNKGPAK